jgi:dTMP kinase
MKDLGAKFRLRKSRFITLEGIDGTFKTTIVNKLANKLDATGISVFKTADPPLIPPWTNLNEQFQTGEIIDKVAEALLLLTIRIDNSARMIKPVLKKGSIVLSDRYVDSWLAYQSVHLEENFGSSLSALIFLINEFTQFASRDFVIWPDLTFLIIDKPDQAVERVKRRGDISKYDRIELQSKVQDIYLFLADMYPERILKIEIGSLGFDNVFQEIWSKINTRVDLFSEFLSPNCT